MFEKNAITAGPLHSYIQLLSKIIKLSFVNCVLTVWDLSRQLKGKFFTFFPCRANQLTRPSACVILISMLLVIALLLLTLTQLVKAGDFEALIRNASVAMQIRIAYITDSPENSELGQHIFNYPALLIHIEDSSGEDFVIVNSYIGVSCPECQHAMIELVTDIYDYLKQLSSCKSNDRRIDALMDEIRSTFGYDTERFRIVLKRAMSLILSQEFRKCSIKREEYKEESINRILLAYNLAHALSGYDVEDGYALGFYAGIISYPSREALDIDSYFQVPYEEPNVVRNLKTKCRLKRPSESSIKSTYSAAISRGVNYLLTELVSEALVNRCREVLKLVR